MPDTARAASPDRAHPEPTHEEQVAQLQAQLFAGIDLLEQNNHPGDLATALQNLWALENSVQKAPDYNFKNQDGLTPLQYALTKKSAHVLACHYLLPRGVDIEVRHPDGSGTPLLIATKRNLIHALGQLIDRRANVEARNNDGDTPALIAVKHNASVLSNLLYANADIEATDKNGDTALLIATQQATDPDKMHPLKTLAYHHASATTRNTHGDNPLLIAVKNNNEQAADILLNHAETSLHHNLKHSARMHINDHDSEGRSALEIAMANQNPILVKMLLLTGADYTMLTQNGIPLFDIATPEMQTIIQEAEPDRIIAAANDHLLLTQYLLRNAITTNDLDALHNAITAGADVNHAGLTGSVGWQSCPLALAAQQKSTLPAITQALIDHQADIDALDHNNFTPLMYAIKHDAGETVQVLLKNKENVSCRSYTHPLYLAIEQGNVALAQHLIALKAPVNAAVYCDKTTNYGHGHDANKWTALHKAIANKNEDLITLLIASGAHPHQPGAKATPLCVARAMGEEWFEFVQETIKKHEAAKRQAILNAYYAQQTKKQEDEEKAQYESKTTKAEGWLLVR